MKRLAAAALTLALGVAATAASAQPISLGTAANFGEGGSAGIVVRNDNPIAGVITVTFRVTFTGGPPEEDPGTLVRPSGGTRLSAFSGGVATGTDTIGSGHLSGNIQFFIEDVDHLPNGTTRVFTITLLSAMAGGDEIALHSDPALLSRSITITFSSTERRFSVSLAPAGASVNVDRDSTAPGLQVDEDFGTSAHQVITFRVTLANVEGGRDVFDNDRASVNWAATVTGAGASGANGSDELTGVRSGTLNFRRDDDNDSADNYEEPQDVEVRVAHDTINEAAQTVVFTLTCSGGNCGGGGTGTGIGTGTATAGILASDPLTVSIGGDQTGNEGNTGDGNTQSDRDARRIRLTVTAAGATASDRDSVEIPFTIGGTAADATDYPASALQFPTGGDYYTLRPASGGARVVSIDLRSSRAMAGVDAFADIDVVPQLDDLNEADETVVITLSAPGASGYATQGGSPAGAILLTGTASSRSATATINDDDGITVGIARRAGQTGAVAEGNRAEFTVSLALARDSATAATAAADICVTFATAIATQRNPAGSANTVANADVEVRDCAGNVVATDAGGAANNGGVLIPAGQSEATLSILARYDDIDEGATDEELTVTITAAAHQPALTGAVAPVITASLDDVSVNIENVNEDTVPPGFLQQGGQPGWSGGQQVLWVRMDEDFKVLPHPSGANGATVGTATPSLATPNALPARDFSVVENHGNPSSATIAVSGVTPFAGVRALRLELQRAIAADAANVNVIYERSAGGANAIYDTAVEDGVARNNMRNATTFTMTGPLTPAATADFDTDGIPDAVEAGIRGAAGNPFVAVTGAQQPAFDISRTTPTTSTVAYSGIREHGVRAHLGVSSAETATRTAAQTITAYYRSDTFGYDGAYRCATGQFPANYNAPLSQGGCAPVDWGDIVPGVDHTIAWFARSADGVWAVNMNTTSKLPEQAIRRIPELNMASQALFTTGAPVVVRAFFDDDPAAGLTLALSRTPDETGETTMFTGGGAGRTLAATDTSPVSALWAITGLTESGGASRLYRPATPTAGFTPNYPATTDHSLGLARQTRVVNTGGAPVPPVLGRAALFDQDRQTQLSVVVEDTANAAFIVSHQLDIPIKNYADIGAGNSTASASDAGGVLDITSGELMAAGDEGVYRINFVVMANVRAMTDTAVIQVSVTGVGGGETTAEYRYPVVEASHGLVESNEGDSDRDGIVDLIDSYDDSAHLPVAVDETAGAGASAWQHIRPVLPVHNLRLGEATVRRLVDEVGTSTPLYAAFSASSVPADGSVAVVYDFEIAGVDYAEVSADARTGGTAGVIIPLPESLAGRGASLVKHPSGRAFSVEGGNDYGFAPLQQDGACPDDTMTAGSPYREGETLRRAKRGDDACLVVYIVDGGANDEDGLANGIIKDPLGVRAGNAVGGGGAIGGVAGSSSGTFGPVTLALLTALTVLLLSASRLRRRRRRTA